MKFSAAGGRARPVKAGALTPDLLGLPALTGRERPDDTMDVAPGDRGPDCTPSRRTAGWRPPGGCKAAAGGGCTALQCKCVTTTTHWGGSRECAYPSQRVRRRAILATKRFSAVKRPASASRGQQQPFCEPSSPPPERKWRREPHGFVRRGGIIKGCRPRPDLSGHHGKCLLPARVQCPRLGDWRTLGERPSTAKDVESAVQPRAYRVGSDERPSRSERCSSLATPDAAR